MRLNATLVVIVAIVAIVARSQGKKAKAKAEDKESYRLQGTRYKVQDGVGEV